MARWWAGVSQSVLVHPLFGAVCAPCSGRSAFSACQSCATAKCTSLNKPHTQPHVPIDGRPRNSIPTHRSGKRFEGERHPCCLASILYLRLTLDAGRSERMTPNQLVLAGQEAQIPLRALPEITTLRLPLGKGSEGLSSFSKWGYPQTFLSILDIGESRPQHKGGRVSDTALFSIDTMTAESRQDTGPAFAHLRHWRTLEIIQSHLRKQWARVARRASLLVVYGFGHSLLQDVPLITCSVSV